MSTWQEPRRWPVLRELEVLSEEAFWELCQALLLRAATLNETDGMSRVREACRDYLGLKATTSGSIQ